MKIFSILFLLVTFEVRAQSEALTSDFKRYITESKLGPVSEQAFCYVEDGKVHGYQTSKLQRIASITKIFSTLLISETADLHQRFTTKIYVGKNSVHIEGGKDPYFEEDKLLLLFQALNDLGIRNLERLSFNSDFLFYDLAMGSYEKITPDKTRVRLKAYLDPKKNSLRNSKWQSIRKFAAEEGVYLPESAPLLTARQVTLTSTNPLGNEKFDLYYHTSKPLHSLLKTMNVQSKNYVAENIYLAGSARKQLGQLLSESGIALNTFKIYNGSGLPMIGRNSRLDNLATCTTVLKVIDLLKTSLVKHNLILSDVMAVNGGKDLGSFRTRFQQYPETHEAVISKTGTLKHTSSLAGVLVTDEIIPFAVLNHSTSSTASRNFQDRFVARMLDLLGPGVSLNYQKISIFPWDGSEFLKEQVL